MTFLPAPVRQAARVLSDGEVIWPVRRESIFASLAEVSARTVVS